MGGMNWFLAYRVLTRAVNGGRVGALAVVFGLLVAAQAVRADPLTIVAFGDSLTAGHGLAGPNAAFPAQLEQGLQGLGMDVRVINAGVSGDTSAGGLSRLAWSMTDAPDLVIVELGANDALRGLDPDATYQNLDSILAWLGGQGIPVLLAGMLAPPNLGDEYGRTFNGIYRRLADTYGTALYPFFLEGVAAKPALLQDDGMHPNPAGVKVIVAGILPFVVDALAAPAN